MNAERLAVLKNEVWGAKQQDDLQLRLNSDFWRTRYAADVAELVEEVERLRRSQREVEDQLVWLADWCRKRFGVENNSVIGRDGWPNRIAEVVAKAADAEITRLRDDLRDILDTANQSLDCPTGDAISYLCRILGQSQAALSPPAAPPQPSKGSDCTTGG